MSSLKFSGECDKGNLDSPLILLFCILNSLVPVKLLVSFANKTGNICEYFLIYCWANDASDSSCLKGVVLVVHVLRK